MRHWLLFFLLVNLACDMPGGPNVGSRYAAIVSMGVDQTFRIDKYKPWTMDWARTPDGAYYSNKAPGPALLALPFFWVADPWMTIGAETREEKDAARWEAKFIFLKLLSLLLQVIPFGLLGCLLLRKLRDQGVLDGVWLEAALGALLLGNTAALYLNKFYGHGLTAVCLLAVTLFLWNRRYPLAGLAFGWAVLCEYSTGLLLLPLLVYVGNPRNILRFCLGGIVPGALWVWYHTAAFGSPFAIANQFQNPAFQDVPGGHLGIFHGGPVLSTLWELTFGGTRGLLWTQPWVLLAVFSSPFWARTRWWWTVVLPGGVLYLAMNAAFGGWHGGTAPGPRYLAPVLPLFAIGLGFALGQAGRWVRTSLLVLVAVTVVFNLLVFVSYSFPGPEFALWPHYVEKVFLQARPTVWVRGIVVLGGMIWLLRQRRKLVV